MNVFDFLARLPEEEHLFVANTIGSGLHQAGMAAQCLTDQDARHQDTTQLLAYLSHAVTELQAVRDFIRERLEA